LRLHAGDSSCSPGVTDSAVSLVGSRSCCFEKELSFMRCRNPFIITSAVSVGAFALLAAGCGGGASPGVASVASSTTTAATTTTAGGSGPGGGPINSRPGGQGHFSIAMNAGSAALGAKFAACMRKHGVTNFPDPNSQGVIQFGSGNGIDPNSPTFQSARSACQKLLPNG